MSIGERSMGPDSHDERSSTGAPGGAPAPLRPKAAARRPGRPRALPLAEQRRVVIDAALRVFATDGYNGATIERVAREAGTARSSVYELFQGKDDLFIAVVEDAADRVVGHLSEGFRASQDLPLRDFARHSFSVVFDMVERDRDAITVLLNAERGGIEPPMASVADTRGRVLEEINRHTGAARWADYGIEVGSASIMLSLMYFGMGEVVAIRQVDDPAWDREALIDLLTEFTVGGLFRLGLHPEVLAAAARRAPAPGG
jgi:AcrR family transcriptional regulator